MDNKKGQVFSNLSGIAVGIAILTITLVISFLVITQSRTQLVNMEEDTYCTSPANLNGTWIFNETHRICQNTSNSSHKKVANLSAAYNSTDTLATSVDSIPGWVPLIVIAVIGSILLGLVALFKDEKQ